MKSHSKFAVAGIAMTACVGLNSLSAFADRDDARIHADHHFDRGARVVVRDRDWRRPEYRDHILRSHRYGWGPGIGFYFSDGWYYGECGWLRRRAEETGSPMWWHRYHRCREFS